MNAISVLVRVQQVLAFSLHSLSQVRIQQEVSSVQPGRGLPPGSSCAGTLILDLHPPELWEIHFCAS